MLLILLCAFMHVTAGQTLIPVDTLRALREANEHAALERAARANLKALQHGPDSLRHEALFHLAFALSGQNDAPGALDHAQQALVLARATNDTLRILSSLAQLTRFNVLDHHYDEADRNRSEQLELARRYGRSTHQLALAHNSVGSMYSRRERIDSAEYHYREGLRVLAGGGDRLLTQVLMGNLGSTLAEKGQHEEAMALHREVMAYVDSSDHLNHAWMLRTLAQSLLFTGRYREAIRTMDDSDSLNRLAGHTLDLAIDLAELRADALDSLGDIAGAYAMTKLARDLQDTLYERSLDAQYLELEKKFETRLKEEEIQRLDAQAQEQQERLQLRNLQLYGSLALAALALGGIVLVGRNLRQKRRHASVLEKLNTELRDQQMRIEEINRLLQLKVLRTQMNPHFIYNSLNAIHNLVQKGEAAAASSYLDGFARLLRMVLDHSVKDHVPLPEELVFLRLYLELEAMRFGDGLHYSLEAEPALLGSDDEVLVPTLLVQPFVENAVWHGLAGKEGDKQLHILFSERDGRVVCTVQDNGVGRQAAPKRAHPDGSASLGLQLTNERLQLLAFKLEGTGRVVFTDLEKQGKPSGTRVELVLGRV